MTHEAGPRRQVPRHGCRNIGCSDVLMPPPQGVSVDEIRLK
jgi:hypothetical protein